MKKVLILLILLFIIVFITGCGEEKGPKLVCTQKLSEQLLQGKTTLTIQYNKEGKPSNYFIDAIISVNSEIYETYGDKKETNMKTISESVLGEIQKGYEQYEPKVNSSVEENVIKVQITVDNQDFLKTIGTIEKEKEIAESELGKFTCTIQN